MEKRSLMGRVICKVNKVLHLDLQSLDPEKVRRKKALAEGRRLKLKKNNYVFHYETLRPKFYLPLYKTDYIQQNILVNKNYYEIENLTMICKEWKEGIVGKYLSGRCIVDIGANIGNHTLYFLHECGALEAICFEPLKNTYEILKKNIEINGFENKVTLYNAAVGSSSGKASVCFFDKTNIGATMLTNDSNGDIQVIAIDTLGINQDIGLIKIDVEGFETFVIQGCIETIRKHKPYIMIEIRDEHFAEISKILSQLGYTYYHTNIINYLFYIKSNNNE